MPGGMASGVASEIKSKTPTAMSSLATATVNSMSTATTT